MTQLKSVLVTGANAGLGKETARQLAVHDSVERIYLGCRNLEKAEAAKAELLQATGKSVFEILKIDVTDMDSVRAAVQALPEPIDGLVMNAGGMGGPTPRAKTPSGTTELFAANVLGHALLASELIAADKLKHVAVYSGSEAMRGVKQVRIKRLALETSSSDEFASIADDSWLDGESSAMAAYSASKYVGIGKTSPVFSTADSRHYDNQAPARATWPLPGAPTGELGTCQGALLR